MAERARSGPLSRPVLSVVALLAFVFLTSLGVWQVRRLQWKQDLLAQVEAARSAPVVPLEAALKRSDPAYARVTAECGPGPSERAAPVYGLREGQVVWRMFSLCGGGDSTVILDRGILKRAVGQVEKPAALSIGRPDSVVAVLTPVSRATAREIGAQGWAPFLLQDRRGQELYLAVERESPPALGIRPQPLPRQLTNNHLGYAITWFGLAAALLGVYVAMLRRPRVTA